MENVAILTAKFEALNKKYLALDKKLNKLTGFLADEISEKMELIQIEMCKISSQIEG